MAQTDFSTFRTRVIAYCQINAQAWIDLTDSIANTAFTDLANEVMKRFSEETQCLFSDAVAITVPTSTNTLNLRDTAVFAREMLQLQRVYISGSPINQTSEEEVSRISPSYLTDPASKPSMWFSIPPEQIILVPKSDQAYSNCFASGWFIHPTLSTNSGATGTLLFRPEDIKSVVLDTAIEILGPRASGTSLDRLHELMAENMPLKQKIKQRAQSLYTGPMVRRRSSRTYSVR